jgi:DNA helicase-2/ATP-dependent DNA helicase PcrA
MVARAYALAQGDEPRPAAEPPPPAAASDSGDSDPSGSEWFDHLPEEPPSDFDGGSSWIESFPAEFEEPVPSGSAPGGRGVAGFEGWLRKRLRKSGRGGPGDGDEVGDGITLSTVHRVKGLEWPVVVVWDASEGVMPHRLNQVGRLLEEERRVFHVALTRARESAIVLARSGAPSTFLGELTGEAVRRPFVLADERNRKPERGQSRLKPTGRGERAELTPEQSKRSDALREWRRKRAKDDGVPAYVVLNDRHLDGIASRVPTTLDELARCDGIGPTKLDRYGDDILAILEDL